MSRSDAKQGPYIEAPDPEELDADVRAELDELTARKGFMPKARLTLAWRPEILMTLNALEEAVMLKGTVEPMLKLLVAEVASTSAGCRHCQAQTAWAAHSRGGATNEKVEAVWDFESSPLFSEAEKAALSLARVAGLSPSAAEAEHFEALREHFDEGEIVEIMSVICLYGWSNRWNDSVATQTSGPAIEYAAEILAPSGWEAGKHAKQAGKDG